MNPAIILGLAIGLPIVVLMVLRINATLVFLSLCLGYVLVQFNGSEADTFMSLANFHGKQVSHGWIEVAMLMLPVILTSVIMIHAVRGAKLAWNILPAAGVGAVGTLMLVPLIPGGTTASLINSGLWHQVSDLETLIVGACTLMCLFFLWMQRPKAHKEDKHHR
jgi:hypothetical protein